MTAAERERLTADERKVQIVHAALPLFASKGFRGTTTKEIAQAAGVSEALLYKHFPSKEQLYRALDVLCTEEASEIGQSFDRVEPSTQALVRGMYFLMRVFLWGMPGQEEYNAMLKRMMVNSLVEDGQFAKLFLEARFVPHIPTIEKLIKAAEKAGDLEAGTSATRARVWITHHLPVGVLLFWLPPDDVVDYQASREETLNEVVCFALRGLGLKEAAIRRHFHPEEFARWMEMAAAQALKR